MQRTDEAQHLFNTIDFTIGVILRSNADDLNRIAFAYQEAQCLAEAIPLAPGNADARPRIVACMNRFEPLQTQGDASCAGWMLMAVQLRLNERNLPGWEALLAAVERAIELLPSPEPTRH